MMESMLETINSVKSANYFFNKFLSASAWLHFVLWLFLRKALLDDIILSVVCFSSCIRICHPIML